MSDLLRVVLAKSERIFRAIADRRVQTTNEAAARAVWVLPEHRSTIPFVDPLSDSDLRKLNELLPWHSFVVDGRGRRFGAVAWDGKRSEPQMIPDSRAVLLDEHFVLADKHVLEIGCFEGNHTVALAQRAAKVSAIDARIENVVKTVVRCAFFGEHPTVFQHDLERGIDPDRLGADVVFHVGVLYHLTDPVTHLRDLAAVIRTGILLDTHFARDAQATESYRVNGRDVRYHRYHEGGAADPFSGTREHAKWLRLDDLLEILQSGGFHETEVVEMREERNGSRVLIIGRKA